MIDNTDVFDRNHIPKDLHHRDGHIQDLKRELGAIPNPRRHNLITIYGPPGSGKTTLARYVARRFDAEYSALEVGYVKCVKGTMTSLLHDLLTQTGQLPRSLTGATSGYDYLACLRDTTDPLLLIVDEVDFLSDHELIQALCGTRGVWTICIGINEHDLLAGMHPGIRSRLQAALQIRLSRYTNHQLRDILWGRIEIGLPLQLVRSDAVKEMTERAHGDARLALELLRGCVSRLDQDFPEPITTDIVDEVEDTAVETVRERYVAELGTHPWLLFSLIKEADSITGSELKCQYEAGIPDPRSDRMRQLYLASLERYNLIYTSGSGRGKRYHTSPP